MSKGKLFVLSAPSGAGKTTVLNKVMSNIPGVAFSISHTTRQPRQGERNGVEYHFVDPPTFLKMRDNDSFLEWAEVHGNFYGTSSIDVLKQIEDGIDVILDIDVQGASIIRKSSEMSATYIFLAPPGIEELERRLRGRGLDSEETIARRLKNAEKEMEAMEEFEYVIVNDEIEQAIDMFQAIILAERSKGRRNFNGKALFGGEQQ